MTRSMRWWLRGDYEWLSRHGVRGLGLVGPLTYSARHYGLRMAGATLGSRADRLPPS